MPANWQPAASIETLKFRAQILAEIRQYFAKHNVLEAETPLLSAAANTDPHIQSISATVLAGAYTGEQTWLHTSPEFFMKRLLAAGSGDIYQICKVFRDGEFGRWHNPEFTMLEWYRTGWNYQQLMDEVAELVCTLSTGNLQLENSERITYQQALQTHTGINPFSATEQQLHDCAARNIPLPDTKLSRDEYLDLIMTAAVEPKLGNNKLTFIYDYPVSQASLAKISETNPLVAERFELYLNGVELANGFTELTNATEQQQRFYAENHQRKINGLPVLPVDKYFILALENGLPDCAGVALGLDRLIALLSGQANIGQALSFTAENS